MIYDLVKSNDPILRQKLEPFDFANPQVDALDLATDLAETLFQHNGLGIAANQIGFNYRVFLMLADELIPVFNPRIVDVSEETIVLEEGCLSHPGLFVKVRRPRRIKVRYAEPNGNVVTRTYDGMTARIFQHEFDHLEGVVYTERANKYHLEQARKKRGKPRPKNALSNETRLLMKSLGKTEIA